MQTVFYAFCFKFRQAASHELFKKTIFCVDLGFQFIATDQSHHPPRCAKIDAANSSSCSCE